ncbi:AMP-binding protein [Sphingomonas sp. AR_OL41]|uniref:class I adenylate-forming enzyme family protein n=1 Tax=Sphingomonas sp. AR_OL41 TaxID=3042729 RepID=UPI002481725A|nr:AMP-binding protein [Sphingomonas sp. AR_OL41]MDH7973243.1 AMP-binding protein [Sphingomonas sp. AR_OL41]
MTRPATLPDTFHAMTFGAALRAAAARDPHKIAILHGEESRTFADLSYRVGQLRDAAIGLGVTKGDVVAIVSRNRPEFIEVVAGVPDAGAAVATINPRLAPGEVAQTLADCAARIVFVDAESRNLVEAACSPAQAGVQLGEVGNEAQLSVTSGVPTRSRLASGSMRVVEFGPQYEALLAEAQTPTTLPHIEEWDGWTIPYTSGTTGKPKGVILSHRSRMLVGLICAAEFGCFGPDDRFLAMTPMNHGGGLGFPTGVLAAGGSIEILDKFHPEIVLERLKFGGITGLFMVPTHFQMIFALPPETLAHYARPPIRSILANAAPLPQALKEKIIPYFGETVLHELYAATETGLVCNLRPKDQLRKVSCVGTTFPHVEAEVRRDDGSVCDPDEVGELWSRGPVLFNGYWDRPEETAKAVKDGWVSVGDMARRDAEGFLYIVDRKKDMVISGGVNIYPREVEEVLFAHPDIADVAVIGVPDETWGERLKAFVVPRGGATVTAETIAAYCTGRIANYKIPRELTCVAELPRNANGKVLKTELRAT